MNSLAIVFALASAFAYASMAVVMRLAISSVASSVAVWITLFINVLILWTASLTIYGWQVTQLWDWRYFIISGFFAPLLARMFQFRGIAELGANVTTPITLTHPVFTILIAITFMGEQIGPVGFVGALLVVASSVLIGSNDKRQTPGQAQARSSHWRYASPVLASLCYGIATVFRKKGMDTIGDPVTAAAVTITTSWILSSLYVFASGSLRNLRITAREWVYFVLTGIFSSVGPVLFYFALHYGDLVTVAPIASAAPLMVLGMTYLFSRSQELFTVEVILGTCGTVLGLMLVSFFRFN